MKVLIIGGHLSPALAVIEKLPKNWEVVFLGRKYVFEGDKSESLEFKTVNERGIKFEELNTGRLQRKFTLNTIPSLFKLPSGLINAIRLIKKNKPDVVLGFGGYVQIPVIIASYLNKIPIVIHEQTLEVGMANRISSFFVKKICISWESSMKFFPKDNVVLTGIPLRENFFKISAKDNKKKGSSNKLLVVGGSSGSHFINSLILDDLKDLTSSYEITHQTGDSKEFNDFEKLENKKNNLPGKNKKNYKIIKFINPDEFPKLLNDSDILISRSGINTVAEAIFLKKPSIFIPIPFSQGDEQLKNAVYAKNLGIAEIIEQKNITSKLLVQKVNYVFNNLDKYKCDNNIVSDGAADKIIQTLKECVEVK